MNWEAVIKRLRETAIYAKARAGGLYSHFPMQGETAQARAEAAALNALADALEAGLKAPSE